MDILIGTSNPSKLALFQEHLSLPEVTVHSPAELGYTCSCPEDARTPEGNAIQKAAAWHQASGLPVFSLDSGLLFLDLPEDHPDQPGTYVRRVNGRTLNDEEMLEHYISLVKKHGGSLRASWQNAACLYFDEAHVFTHVKSRKMLEKSAFLLTDIPATGRHDGWPLDSLSVNIATGRHYLEEESAKAQEVESPKADLWRGMLTEWIKSVLAQMQMQN